MDKAVAVLPKKYGEVRMDSGVERVALLCSVLSVSRSVYYAWTTAVESGKAKCDKELKAAITTAFTQNRAVYGTRRLKSVGETRLSCESATHWTHHVGSAVNVQNQAAV